MLGKLITRATRNRANYHTTFKKITLPEDTRDAFSAATKKLLELDSVVLKPTAKGITTTAGFLNKLLEKHGNFKESLNEFKTGESSPVLIIEGCNILEKTPPTPHSAQLTEEQWKIIAPITYFTFGVFALVGRQPWKACNGFTNTENTFNVIANHAPSGMAANKCSSGAQLMHVDQYKYPENIPEMFSLFTLHNTEKTPTDFITANKIWSTLNEESQRELLKPNFAIQHILTDHNGFQYARMGKPFSIFWLDKKGQPHINFDLDCNDIKYREENTNAKSAMRELLNVIQEIKPESHISKAGDLVIVDNTRVMHGRKEIPGVDAKSERRWLLRCYAENTANKIGFTPNIER
jgi:hypothetical protein